MKGLKKLVLATAVAAAPFAQAELTAMDDSFLEGMTGQSGISLDIDLDVQIAEIRYADEDGYGEDVSDGGFLTLSNIVIDGTQGANGDQALIRGVTIDVDKTDGIVIGFGQIGSQSATAAASSVAAVATGDYWTGVNVSADFGVNGTQAGTLEVKNFTNFVPNALAVEGVQKFGYSFDGSTGPIIALTDNSGTQLTDIGGAIAPTGLIAQEYAALVGGGSAQTEATMATAKANVLQETDAATVAATGTNGFADALVAGTHVDAFVAISAGGAVGEGLTINAEVGFVIQEMSFADDGLKMGIHNFTMFDTDDTTGEITGFRVEDLKIDVVARTADANSQATAALQISGLNTYGTIAMGDIFIGDHTNGSIGAVSIRDIDMSNTAIRIYGH